MPYVEPRTNSGPMRRLSGARAVDSRRPCEAVTDPPSGGPTPEGEESDAARTNNIPKDVPPAGPSPTVEGPTPVEQSNLEVACFHISEGGEQIEVPNKRPFEERLEEPVGQTQALLEPRETSDSDSL